jgi:activator of HSP90 ATPase
MQVACRCANLNQMKTTRRRMGLILAGSGASLSPAQTVKSGTAFRQEVDFEVAPARIYEILLDAKQFSAFTKDTAEVRPEAGAPFKLFGGRIEGRNVELVANRRIVQAWRPANWPAGEYSLVRFELTARGQGTRIVLDHSGFAADKWEGLNSGWPERYWEPMHKYLNG